MIEISNGIATGYDTETLYLTLYFLNLGICLSCDWSKTMNTMYSFPNKRSVFFYLAHRKSSVLDQVVYQKNQGDLLKSYFQICILSVSLIKLYSYIYLNVIKQFQVWLQQIDKYNQVNYCYFSRDIRIDIAGV